MVLGKWDEGDNSDVLALEGPGQADIKVLGNEETVVLLSGRPNSGTSPGWQILNNSNFLLPYNVEINSSGLYTNHNLDELTGPGQVNNFPSVHFKTNLSMPVDMTDYIITNVTLEVSFNASVQINVDSFNDWNDTVSTPEIDWDKFLIGDSANFYVELSDLDNSYPFKVANFETRDLALGQGDRAGFPDILNITDRELNYAEEQDIITALNSALETDHQNFTINLGLDIYCEDNRGSPGDQDYWNYLIFKSCNLTVTYVKKIDQSTTISWNQIGNKINGSNHQITDATLKLQYLMDKSWPTSAPLSELRVFINNKTFNEGIVKLSSFNTTFQDLKTGGIDVTSLVSTDVNISISIQLFLKDDFTLDENISVSIDNVYLNISYIRTFPDTQTALEVFLNNDNKTLDPFIQIPEGFNLNITVKYGEVFSKLHISNASVQLEGKVSGTLTEDLAEQQYTIIVNVSLLGIGTRLLTIVAGKNDYDSKTFQFLVEVTERDTEMLLFIDGVQKYDNSTTSIELNEVINITVLYRDFFTQNNLSGAFVNLLGVGRLNETGNYYNITVTPMDLTQGINVMSIFAQLDNYQSQTIQFFIEVTEISSKLQLYLNNEEKTLDPFIELPIGSLLNITVKYLENQTSLYINNAAVQLIGEGISTNLTENSNLQHFSNTFNTSDFNLGVKFFTIIAQAIDYRIIVVSLRVSINRIRTEIRTESGESVITARSGGNVRLKLILNNTDYGGIIKGASLTYSWSFGQGELTDIDNDGIYEVVLRDIPAGSYIIVINAFVGEDFEFQTYEITLSVSHVTGPDLTWLIAVLSVGALGLGLAITLYQTHFKYSPFIRKIRKIKKKIRKGRKVKPLLLKDREAIYTERYQESLSLLEKGPTEIEKQEVIEKVDLEKFKINKKGGSSQ
jgi:hypothetical protein